MQMPWRWVGLLTLSLWMLTACSPESEQLPTQIQLNNNDTVLKELVIETVKPFPLTPHDPNDIQQLMDYETAFNTMSDAMEDELLDLQAQQELSAQFIYERKTQNTQAALQMLKDLNLKTPQGQYIQTLWAQYWQSQKKILEHYHQRAEQVSSRDHVKDLGRFLHANEQLEHWRKQIPSHLAQTRLKKPE